jgi:hypothetical protein
MKLPLVKHLVPLIKSIKKQIDNDYRAFDEDEIPGIQLTVGACMVTGEWDYQTGDNSYSGSAYGYSDWGVVGVYRNSNALEVARDIRNQLREAVSWC